MPQAHPKRWLILFVILGAECMDLLDGTVVNVAAPTINHDLHTSSTALQWIVGGYALALAVGLLIGARLGDIAGRRRLFMIGVSGFTLASLLCGLAPSTGVLIVARLLQGTAGAMMLPQGLGIIREVFTPEELPRAFGVFGPVMGSAAMIGPILGGGLIALDLFGSGWRMVFLINLPVGIAALAGAYALLPRTGTRHASSLDLTGAVLSAVSAIAIVYPLVQGRELGWPAWTYATIATGLVLLGVLGLHLRRRVSSGRSPLIEPGIFRYRGYSAGALVLLLYFGGMIGSMLAITLFVQLGEGFSAIHAGLTLAPFALGTGLSAPLAAHRMTAGSARALIQAGTVVSLIGYVAMAVILGSTDTVTSWGLLGPLLVIGLGMGLFIVPVFDTIIAAVSDAETGSASGALNALQQLGGAIGVAVLGSVFFSALAEVGFAGALRRELWWQVGIMVALLALTPLLPRTARPTEPGGAEAANGATAPATAPIAV